MEEISWGQRVFGIESSEFFKANNLQSETNFHNMEVNGVKINKLVFGKLMFLFLLIHNIFWPMAVSRLEPARKLHEKIGNFIPPWPQVILFIIVALLVELVTHQRHKEILEITGSFHYLVSVVACFGLGFDRKALLTESGQRKALSILSSLFAFIFIGLFINFYICLLYTSPSPRDATLSRMPSSA